MKTNRGWKAALPVSTSPRSSWRAPAAGPGGRRQEAEAGSQGSCATCTAQEAEATKHERGPPAEQRSKVSQRANVRQRCCRPPWPKGWVVRAPPHGGMWRVGQLGSVTLGPPPPRAPVAAHAPPREEDVEVLQPLVCAPRLGVHQQPLVQQQRQDGRRKGLAPQLPQQRQQRL